MSEQTMWNTIRPLMKGMDPVRVENPAEPGTPDVNYVEGWIELKWVRKAPVRGGILHIEHFTEDQRTWLIQRHAEGGRAHLLLKVSNEWLLFWGWVAAEHIGKSTLEELRIVAEATWRVKITGSELRQKLRASVN